MKNCAHLEILYYLLSTRLTDFNGFCWFVWYDGVINLVYVGHEALLSMFPEDVNLGQCIAPFRNPVTRLITHPGTFAEHWNTGAP